MSEIGFYPLPEQVIIEWKPNRPAEVNGIVLAEAEFEPIPFRGDVVAVGEGVDSIKVGNHILFKQDKPEGFKHDGKRYLRVRLREVVGIVDEQKSA